MMEEVLTSEQISRVLTTYSPRTIREFAAKGQLPVARWAGGEPEFRRDARTIGALLALSREGRAQRGR